MDLGLKNKTALVTGGSHGIGLATAQALAVEGCNIILVARNAERVLQAADSIKKTYGVRTHTGIFDVTSDGKAEALFQLLISSDLPDILINNVGGGGRLGDDLLRTDDSLWLSVMSRNLLAAVQFTRLALPSMKINRWGRVVTVSSIYGKETGGPAPFNAAKAAEISFMKSMSHDIRYARCVTFNTVCPGFIDVYDAGDERRTDAEIKALEHCPASRMGSPEEVASAICFLCSEQASYINGACLTIDGGASRSF